MLLPMIFHSYLTLNLNSTTKPKPLLKSRFRKMHTYAPSSNDATGMYVPKNYIGFETIITFNFEFSKTFIFLISL